jgi:hypothetical protein
MTEQQQQKKHQKGNKDEGKKSQEGHVMSLMTNDVPQETNIFIFSFPRDEGFHNSLILAFTRSRRMFAITMHRMLSLSCKSEG